MCLAVLLPLCLVYLLCLFLHLPCLHVAYYCVVVPYLPDDRTPISATPGRRASHEATRLLRWRPVRGDGSVHRRLQPATSHPYSPLPRVILRAARSVRDDHAYRAYRAYRTLSALSPLAAVVDAKASLHFTSDGTVITYSKAKRRRAGSRGEASSSVTVADGRQCA